MPAGSLIPRKFSKGAFLQQALLTPCSLSCESVLAISVLVAEERLTSGLLVREHEDDESS